MKAASFEDNRVSKKRRSLARTNKWRASYFGIIFLLGLLLSALFVVLFLSEALYRSDARDKVYYLGYAILSLVPLIIYFVVQHLANKSSRSPLLPLSPRLDSIVKEIKATCSESLGLNQDVQVVLNPSSSALNADIRLYKNKPVVVLTVGSGALAIQDKGAFAALLLHEFAHASHKDIDLWRLYDVYGSLFFLFVIPFNALSSAIFILYMSQVDSASSLDNLIFTHGYFFLLFLLSGTLYFRVWLKFILSRSEEAADLAVVEAGHGHDMIRLLNLLDSCSSKNGKGSKLIRWRIKRINHYMNAFEI